MSSRCAERTLAALAVALATVGAQAAEPEALRVCADPDNLPLSHHERGGYEIDLARVLAEAAGMRLQIVWQPLQRGLVRKSIGTGRCDVLIGLPAGYAGVATTRPYLRAGYVFVTRRADPAPLASFDDPRIAALRIGVQLPGDDGAATPPGHALVRAGALQHVHGEPLQGHPPSAQRLAAAVARGTLDAAVVWGPQVGWFAAQSTPALRVTPAMAPAALPNLPFEYDIALGVRPGDGALLQRLQAALDANRERIEAVLAAWSVPRR